MSLWCKCYRIKCSDCIGSIITTAVTKDNFYGAIAPSAGSKANVPVGLSVCSVTLNGNRLHPSAQKSNNLHLLRVKYGIANILENVDMHQGATRRVSRVLQTTCGQCYMWSMLN